MHFTNGFLINLGWGTTNAWYLFKELILHLRKFGKAVQSPTQCTGCCFITSNDENHALSIHHLVSKRRSNFLFVMFEPVNEVTNFNIFLDAVINHVVGHLRQFSGFFWIQGHVLEQNWKVEKDKKENGVCPSFAIECLNNTCNQFDKVLVLSLVHIGIQSESTFENSV